MNSKQTKFVLAYLESADAETAAAKCGLSAAEGRAMIVQGTVIQAIEAARLSDALSERVYQRRILGELAKIAFSDVRDAFDFDGGLIPVREWSDELAGAVASIKIKQPSQADIRRAMESRKDDNERFEDELPMPKPDIDIRLWDKVAALRLAGSHLAMFVERQDITSKTGIPDDLIDVLNAARQRVIDMRPAQGLLSGDSQDEAPYDANESGYASCDAEEEEGAPHQGPRATPAPLYSTAPISDSKLFEKQQSHGNLVPPPDIDEFLSGD